MRPNMEPGENVSPENLLTLLTKSQIGPSLLKRHHALHPQPSLLSLTTPFLKMLKISTL